MEDTQAARGVPDTLLSNAPDTLPDYQTGSDFDDDDLLPRPMHWPTRRRILTVSGILLALILLIVLPPLVNVNRFRKQIASSISRSLGRPVRVDSVALTMLPMPGFTLQHFVVGEDPAFGAEPVISAESVRVTLRWRSLWRRRVEFSRITLADPSVNLVHLPDGRWNLESILLQAARMPAAPTAQKGAGDAPRFPYIEATGARVNVKLGAEKMPFSLTEAKFSLWLPQPNQWKLRLEAHPSRTDTAAADTGLLRAEGTLGKSGTLEGVPVDLRGAWSAAPLGAVSWLLLGRDAGLRGVLNLTASVHGTIGVNVVETSLEIDRLRRADFVPDHPLAVALHCTAQATALFHQLHSVRCSWPGATPDSGLEASGNIPDVFHPESAAGQIVLRNVPVASLLTTARTVSARIAPDLTASGKINGTLRCCAEPNNRILLAGPLTITAATLSEGDKLPFLASDLQANLDTSNQGAALTIPSVPLNLGAPAPALLDFAASLSGYRLHLSGSLLPSRLKALTETLPQAGDGLEQVLPTTLPQAPETLTHVDASANRTWGGPQVWTTGPTRNPPAQPRRRHRRAS